MASIYRPAAGRPQVRWRDPDGRQRKKTCPNEDVAKIFLEEVERCEALGQWWEPPSARRQADLELIFEDFLKDRSTDAQKGTLKAYAQALELFLRWLRSRPGGRLDPDILTKRLLQDFYLHLSGTGRHGRARKTATAKKYVQVVQRAWDWAADDEDFADLVPRPRQMRFKAEERSPVMAPTWTEMDLAIEHARGPHQVLAVVLRFTGLRVHQAMHLEWRDIDLEAATLTLRGELGKSKSERQGRLIPVSRHLVEYLAGLGRRDGFIVPSNRDPDGPRAREARQRDMIAAWARAGVRKEVWTGRSHHAFRKGFVSELTRAGANTDAVEHLVGHKLPGLRSVYTDPNALPLRAAVDLIPPLNVGKVISLDGHRKLAVGAPRAPHVPAAKPRIEEGEEDQEVGLGVAEAHGNRTRRDPRQGAPIGFEDRAAHQPRMRPHGPIITDLGWLRVAIAVLVLMWAGLICHIYANLAGDEPQASLLGGSEPVPGASVRESNPWSDTICQTCKEEGRMARIFKDGRNRAWGIDYTDPHGRRVRRVVGNKAEAQAALARVQVAILEGQYGRLAPHRPATLEDLVELWRKEKADLRSARTKESHIERLERLLGPQCRVSTLGRATVADLRRAMEAEGIGPATRNRHVATLRAMIRLAEDHDLIPRNPMGRVKMEKEPPPPNRVCAPTEEDRLLAVAEPREALILVWALETGARRGEMVAARWADLDLIEGEWHIPDTKSGEPRTVPLTPRAIEALKRWRADPIVMITRARKPHRLDGHPLVLGGSSTTAISKSWVMLCERAGVEGLRLHDLRHTCATRMRRRGVHPVTLAAMLGHKSWQMVQRYQKVTLDDLRIAAEVKS